MKVRVIDFTDFANYCEEKDLNLGIHELTDKQFMQIFGNSDWEFDSLEAFATEFNADGAFAPMPSEHIIRFFPNE